MESSEAYLEDKTFEEGQLLVCIPTGSIVRVLRVESALIEVQDIGTREEYVVPEEGYNIYRVYDGGR